MAVEAHDDQAGAFQSMLAGIVGSVAIHLSMPASVVLDGEAGLRIQEIWAPQM